MVADNGAAAEHGSASVNNNMITHVGVALAAFNKAAVFFLLKTFRAERYPLVEFNMVADTAGFAYDNAGTMVNKKVRTNMRAGVNIDARNLVGVFGHHAGNQRQVQFKEAVRQTKNTNRLKGGVGQHYLFPRTRGGVAFIRRLNIGIESLANERQRRYKVFDNLFRLFLTFLASLAGRGALGAQHVAGHLIEQHSRFLPVLRYNSFQKLFIGHAFIIHTGIHSRAQQANQLLHATLHTVAADGRAVYLVIAHKLLRPRGRL